MKDVNKVILVGRLGADPVQRETKNGMSVVHFPVATSFRVKPKEGVDGEIPEARSEETQWHRIVAWGKQGEVCAQYLKKGQSVFIEGVLKTRKFEGKDGNERLSVEVHADNVSFLGGGNRFGETAKSA